MLVELPLEPFNTAVRNGTAGQTIEKIVADLKPETIYFCERNGKRGCVAAVNVNDSSEIPKLAEPWFLQFNAHIEFRIAMTPEDLGKAGLDALGKKWG